MTNHLFQTIRAACDRFPVKSCSLDSGSEGSGNVRERDFFFWWLLCVRPVCRGRRCSRPTTRCSHAQRQRGQEVDPVRKGPRESPCRGQGIWHPHVSACSFFSVLRPERNPQKMIFCISLTHNTACEAFCCLPPQLSLHFSFFFACFLS